MTNEEFEISVLLKLPKGPYQVASALTQNLNEYVSAQHLPFFTCMKRHKI
jgi:hypothetical protein